MEIREKYFEERFQGPSILFFKLRVTDAHPLRETHAIPLLGDQLGVDGLVGAAEQGCKRTVVAVCPSEHHTVGAVASFSAGFRRLVSGQPSGGRELGDSIDREVCQAWQDRAKIVANRDF